MLMPAATLDGPVRPLSELMWMCTSLALWPERSQRPGLQPVALPKPDGGVRPIAIGEVLRRLTGKCLMHLVHEDARAHFWPAQTVVAVKAGAEAAVHTLRSWVGRHSGATDRIAVKLDFRNAFNAVSREVVLHQARDHVPALARWATWC